MASCMNTLFSVRKLARFGYLETEWSEFLCSCVWLDVGGAQFSCIFMLPDQITSDQTTQTLSDEVS